MGTLSSGFFAGDGDQHGQYLSTHKGEYLRARNASDGGSQIFSKEARNSDYWFVYMRVDPDDNSWSGPFVVFSYKYGSAITHDPDQHLSDHGLSLASFTDDYQQAIYRVATGPHSGKWTWGLGSPEGPTCGPKNNDGDHDLCSLDVLPAGVPWTFGSYAKDGLDIHDVPGSLHVLPPYPSSLLVPAQIEADQRTFSLISELDSPADDPLYQPEEKVVGETIWEWPFVTDPENAPSDQVKRCMYYVLRRSQLWEKLEGQKYPGKSTMVTLNSTITFGTRATARTSLREALGIAVTKSGGLSFRGFSDGVTGAARAARRDRTSKRLGARVSEGDSEYEHTTVHETDTLGSINRYAIWRLTDIYTLYRIPNSPGENATLAADFNQARERYEVARDICQRQDNLVIDTYVEKGAL